MKKEELQNEEAKEEETVKAEEASEEKETTETEENHETEEQGETVEVSEEKDDKGKKQFILKNLSEKGIYLVKAEFSQGTVEYGFEVK